MNIKNLDPTKCTGCFACVSSCPTKCISISLDREGFSIPILKEDLCVNCGICLQNCHAFNSHPIISNTNNIAFGAQRKNSNLLKKSSSGGIATLLSEYVIKNGGVVYGSYMSDTFEVKHIRVDDERNLHLLSRSKYVQSFTGGIFEKVASDVAKKIPVLFIGTPCQISAVRYYLNKEYENIIFVDLICHGVPSNELFQSYINYLGPNISNYKFRDNTSDNWIDGANISYIKGSKKYHRSQHIDTYGSSFFWGENYRLCCYSCKYAMATRVGDITIGDFWGFHKLNLRGFKGNMKDGISAIICNSDKGLKIFKSISTELYFVKTSSDDIAKFNPNLTHPTTMPKIRKRYYDNFKKHGFSWVSRRRFLKIDFYKFAVKRLIPKKLIYFFKKKDLI